MVLRNISAQIENSAVQNWMAMTVITDLVLLSALIDITYDFLYDKELLTYLPRFSIDTAYITESFAWEFQ